MPREIATNNAAAPASNYAQAVEVEPECRTLYISGQVGVDAEGTPASTEQGQHEMTWDNILAILKEARMTGQDIVEMTAYVTDPNGIAMFRQVRDQKLQGHKAASTVVVVPALAQPQWQVEITVVAARRGD